MSVRILIGDVMDRLRELPPDSVHCVVTSPPYWGLRDYGVAGQIGLEPTYREHIAKLVEVFAEVRRVLRPDGTLWLNYGDCWETSPNGRSAADSKAAGTDDRTFRDKPFSTIGGALKAKDAALLPHRLAIALQEDGWWVRSDIVWAKNNPMPSSVKDRPTCSKEYLFLLTKRPRYYFDDVAIMEPLAESSQARLDQDVENQRGSDRANGGRKTNGPMKAVADQRFNFRRPGGHLKMAAVPGQKPQVRADRASTGLDPRGRRKRDVWTIATESFSEAHFATMPTKLVEPCILAGTSEKGVCARCGAPWVRGESDEWKQACACPPAAPIPATVLDPFGGAGTVALVADRLRRDAILIELNPAYAELARRRIAGDQPLLAEVDLREAVG